MNGKHDLKLGMQPFWFWNGDMEEETIVEQIREMKRKGIQGFMIHPRQGMGVPYMSREYFDRVSLAVETAGKNGMEVWLYDEYPYPSGICGGEVVLDHPEFLSKRLEKKVEIVQGGKEVKLYAPWGNVLLARAYRTDGQGNINLEDYIELRDYVGTGYCQEVFQYSGLTEYNKKRYFTGDQVKFLHWNAPEGIWKIYLVTETVTKHFKYFENYIDTMNPEAVRYFIELTHERYKREIGAAFGSTVKGIFTDEITAFPDSQPWSPRLRSEVLQRHGIDLTASLPALWEELGELSAKVRYAYRCTAADCFMEAYDKQISDWCRANGLLYAGEKPILRSRQLQYFDIPGIDTGHQKVGSAARMIGMKYRANGKMVSSAAHFYHKPAALCEVGHSIGWGMTMQDMKWMFDWIGVQGVDFFVIHGFFYTTDGLKKHDAPPSAFYQMPWWEDAEVLTNYASELGEFLRTTKRHVKLLLIDPITSVWTSGREMGTRLLEDFARLQNQMLYQGLDYYIIDPELFAEGDVVSERGSVEYRIHGERYEMVVLPPMRNLERDAGGKLLEFARKGGKICGLYSIPFEEIQEGSEVRAFGEIFGTDGEALWSAYCQGKKLVTKETGSCCLAGSIEEAVGWMTTKVNMNWEINAVDGLGREGLPIVSGTGEDGAERLFVVNTSGNARWLEVRDPHGRSWKLALEAYESRRLECGCCLEAPHKCLTMKVEGDMEFELEGPNAIRLGFWELILSDGQSAEVETAPLIDQLEKGGFTYPVIQKKYFGCPKELDFKGAEVEYRMKVFCSDGLEPQEPVYLVMEPETFLGEWSIRINGEAVEEKWFFRKKIYLDTNLAAEVGRILVPGENEMIVKMKVDVSFGGMRNPLYLFGNFGVERRGDEWHLTPLRRSGKLGDFVQAGIPFYYGAVTYTGEFLMEETDAGAEVCETSGDVSEGDVYVRLENVPWLADSVRLSAGGYETSPCPWQPYIFRFPSGCLKQGKNMVKIKLRNTALGLFEGQRFDCQTHSYEAL